MDVLRRALAPIADEAWKYLDEQAVDVLKTQLSARTLVDFSGPHGIELGAVNLGRLDVSGSAGEGGVPWGVRRVLPLVELRIPFVLSQMEVDNISRGAREINDDPLRDAARKLALLEERTVYLGFAEAHIEGIVARAAHPPINLPGSPEEYPRAVADAVNALHAAGIGGPYALVLGTTAFYALRSVGATGYPAARIVRKLIDGEILWSPALDGGVLLSRRGGDFELTVGQDVVIGYAYHDRDKIELYLTESFTFRVLEPLAAVALRAG
jgi:uncharacterized linocin/CFP29 family protein